MKKEIIVILGASGTVGSAMQRQIEELNSDKKYEVVCWNRKETPLNVSASDDCQLRKRISRALSELSPCVVFNFALAGSEQEGEGVNVLLPAFLSELSVQQGFKLVHTSSVMVFAELQKGPFEPERTPGATEGYGFQKLCADKEVIEKSSDSVVARLGWQIGAGLSANTMNRFLNQKAIENKGTVEASSKWFPACSRVEDTVKALWELRWCAGGVYHIDSNSDFTFFEIVKRLKSELNERWKVVESEDFVYDQRMLDTRLKVPSLF